MKEQLNKPEGQSGGKKKRVIRIVLLALLAVILLACLTVYFLFTHYISKLNYVERDGSTAIGAISSELEETGGDGISQEEKDSIDQQLLDNLEAGTDWDYDSKNVTNILFIGVDNDNTPGMNDLGNADGLVIASINKNTKQIVLTSLMRDIYISIPDAYNTKITNVYHVGGTELLIDTIEANFGIPIDNYILVNYINVVDIVDAFGGLTLDVSESELYYMEEKIRNINTLVGQSADANMLSTTQAGEINLNGVQTAAYLRIRMAGNNDFERTERARRVLLGLKDKAAGMSFLELNNMANTVLPCITTDLTQGEIFSLLLNSTQYMKYEMVSSRIPIDDSFYFADMGGSMLVIDYSVNKEYLYNTIYQGNTP